MNLIKSLTDQFGGQIVKGLAGNLGIGENDARSSMNGAIPSILGGLINKVGTNAGTDELFDLVKKDDYSGGMLDNLGSLFGGGTNSSLLKTGASLLPMLLGGNNRMGGILDIAGRVFGGGSGRQRSVLSMLAPLVISFISKRLRGGNNMNKSGLVDLLSGQKGYVRDTAHPEMAKALGFADWKDDKKVVRKEEGVHTTAHHEEKSAGGLGFLKWLLPLLLFGLLGMFLMRGCSGDTDVKKVESKKQPVKTEKTQPKPKPVETKQPATQQPVKQNTTNQKPVKQNTNNQKPATQNTNAKNQKPAANTTQKPPVRKGINNKATGNNANQTNTTQASSTKTYTGEAKMFQDAAKAGTSTVVNFGTLSPDGKALSAPAKTRLDQIAEIMKATPGLNIEVRGHNKDQGGKVKNGTARAASKVRAGLVQAYLVTKGIKANRIKSTSIGHDEILAGVPATDDKQKRITIKTTK